MQVIQRQNTRAGGREGGKCRRRENGGSTQRSTTLGRLDAVGETPVYLEVQ